MLVLVLCVVLAGVAIGGVQWRSKQNASHTIDGSMKVADEYAAANLFAVRNTLPTLSPPAAGKPCTMSGGFSDIQQGAQVTVKDDTGKVIATGTLASGHRGEDGYSCQFDFTLPDVPKSNYYQVEVASARRGESRYSYADLESANWRVDLSLVTKS